MDANQPRYAWTTLITRSSYLAGVLILAHSLQKVKTKYPLVVLYTPSLPSSSIAALRHESAHSNIILAPVDPLTPPVSGTLIAERFADTWTKLRCFGPALLAYHKACYLDADMLVRHKIDSLLDATPLPSPTHLAATHLCICNCDGDPWAPADWTPANCPFTPLTHPASLSSGLPITPSSPRAHHQLNSGLFIWHPSPALWHTVLDYFKTSPKLAKYDFPDQDFLADFFSDRWIPLSWRFNAIKTMRYWHTNLWQSDDLVSVLHYIVDKPWVARVPPDGVAGYMGRDGVTHMWWWEAYEEWVCAREAQGEVELLEIASKHVARRHGEVGDEDEGFAAIGANVQAFATNKTSAKATAVL